MNPLSTAMARVISIIQDSFAMTKKCTQFSKIRFFFFEEKKKEIHACAFCDRDSNRGGGCSL